MKRFNTTAVCIPEKHYMVDITEKVEEIKKLVDDGRYFTINRARQYGKTTVLEALDRRLSGEYDVISLDFQDITGAVFYDESTFTKGLAQVICDTRDALCIPVPDEYYDKLHDLAGRSENLVLNDLFRVFDRWLKENSKHVVLIIDEVDTAANNQVFLDFLGKLRSNYLKREKNPAYKTFHSVILAGVSDIKHIKGKIRTDSAVKENSPWNIAADFDVDMSLSEKGIRGMLEDYEADHGTGMDTAYMAKLIYEETSGYPFLVSRICQFIDEKISKDMTNTDAWTREGFLKAVKMILADDNTLFQTITKNLNNHPELKRSLKKILMEGEKITYNAQNTAISQMKMYGFIKNENNTVAIANRTFETMLYNLFMSDAEFADNVFCNNADLAEF